MLECSNLAVAPVYEWSISLLLLLFCGWLYCQSVAYAPHQVHVEVAISPSCVVFPVCSHVYHTSHGLPTYIP